MYFSEAQGIPTKLHRDNRSKVLREFCSTVEALQRFKQLAHPGNHQVGTTDVLCSDLQWNIDMGFLPASVGERFSIEARAHASVVKTAIIPLRSLGNPYRRMTDHCRPRDRDAERATL